jgi:hypothetical protein
MFGEKKTKIIKTIPLSNDTVSRRISNMVYDKKEQLFGTIRGCPCFGIQLGEITDVTGIAQLIVFYAAFFKMKYLKIFNFVRHLKHRQKVKIFSSR